MLHNLQYFFVLFLAPFLIQIFISGINSRIHYVQTFQSFSLLPSGTTLQAYLWDNNQSVVEWLEKHLSKEDGGKSAIRENIKYLKRENALKHIRRYTFTTKRFCPMNILT